MLLSRLRPVRFVSLRISSLSALLVLTSCASPTGGARDSASDSPTTDAHEVDAIDVRAADAIDLDAQGDAGDTGTIEADASDAESLDAVTDDSNEVGAPDAGDIDGGAMDATDTDASDSARDGGDIDSADTDSAPPDAGACTYTILPATKNFSTRTSSGSTSICITQTVSLAVTVTAGCPWTARADGGTGSAGWLTITAGGGPAIGTGTSQMVSYRVLSNAHGVTSRMGTITVFAGGVTPTTAVHTVSQVADPGHACP